VKIVAGCRPKRLFWGICLLVLAWTGLSAGMGRAMAPMQDQHRKKAVQELYENYKKNFPEVPEVTPEEALKLLETGQAVFVDVRQLVERRISRLPEAVSAKEYLNCPDRYLGKTVIAYDTVGCRSGLFAEKMRQKGLGMANLQGGLLGWLHAGGKIYDSNGRETRRVHIYGCLWNYAPEGCETVR
jgi:rhodanese-related sulfurtransferase